MSSYIAGIDGARGGWVVATSAPAFTDIQLTFVESVDHIVDDLLADRCAAAAIDMPIGLSANGHRPADDLARTRLGARRSTFFPTPTRSVLNAPDFETANRLHRQHAGKGLSIQAWNLVPKIREIDQLWNQLLTNRLVEAHPELSFAEMAGGPLPVAKATAAGAAERRALLGAAFADPARVDDALRALPKRFRIDVLDALVMLWTAARTAKRSALVLGGDEDEHGRPMMLHI